MLRRPMLRGSMIDQVQEFANRLAIPGLPEWTGVAALLALLLVADGLTAAAVARRLVVAERTVHKHLERAYAKLGVSDRVSAVLRAQRLGILSEPALAMAR